MTLTYLTNSSYIVFLTTSLSTTTLNFFKSTGIGFNLPTFTLATLLFKLFEALGTIFNSSISNSSTSDFKLDKSYFLENFDVSRPAAFLKSDAVV